MGIKAFLKIGIGTLDKIMDNAKPQNTEAVEKAPSTAPDKAEAVEKDTENNKEEPIRRSSEANNLDLEGIKKIVDTEEFGTFRSELNTKINDLVEYVSAHQNKYNCSVFIGVNFISNKDASGCNTGGAFAGNGYSLAGALSDLWRDDLRHIIIHAAKLRLQYE